MKIKIFFLIFFSILTTRIYPNKISSIHNLTFNRKTIDFDSYRGAIDRYDNRLIVNSQGKLEEFLLNDDGSLEKILSYDTKLSTGGNSSFLIGDRYFRFVEDYDRTSYSLLVFDLNTIPLNYITKVRLPHIGNGRIFHIDFGDYILLVDNYMQISYKLNKNTLTIDGYISGLYGLYVANENHLFWSIGYSDGRSEIHIYDLNDTSEHPWGKHITTVNARYIPTGMKIENNILYYFGYDFIYIFDISDVYNLIEIVYIYTPWESHYDRFYYVDAILHEYLLITKTNKNDIYIYDLSEDNKKHIIATWGSGANNSLSLNFPYLYSNNESYLSVYDIDDDFSEIYKYGITPFDLYGNLYNLDTIYIENDVLNSVFRVIPLFTQDYVEYKVPNQKEIISIKIDLNTMILCRRDEYNIYYFEQYLLEENEAILTMSQTVNRFEQMRVSNGFYYLSFVNAPGGTIIESATNYVYQLTDNALHQYLVFDGDIYPASFSNIFVDTDYIIAKRNNQIEIRDAYKPEIVLYTETNQVFNGILRVLNDTEFSVIALGGASGNNFRRYFQYNSSQNEIELLHAISYLDTTYSALTPFNGITTGQTLYSREARFYTILNGEYTQIGYLDNSSSTYQTSFVFPEHNTVVAIGWSGIYTYSMEYTEYVSESDPTTPLIITELLSNFPNPFNPETTIRFDLAVDSPVSIDIYNIRGQKVRRVFDGFVERGSHSVIWDGRDEEGRE
ncbi:MAG: hypothetical protein FWG98_14060, partial [Candidatus Cloacimonetes bacterium]|nr:hypothetical protein [Candidatus Cloacimonadota bacterium]